MLLDIDVAINYINIMLTNKLRQATNYSHRLSVIHGYSIILIISRGNISKIIPRSRSTYNSKLWSNIYGKYPKNIT